VAETANGRAAAAAADGLATTDPLYRAVVSLGREEAPSAFEQLDGDFHASLKSVKVKLKNSIYFFGAKLFIILFFKLIAISLIERNFALIWV
jgi:hypothetical protein